jgi:hypothetical protein
VKGYNDSSGSCWRMSWSLEGHKEHGSDHCQTNGAPTENVSKMKL